ncbi:flagellar filament capping protein FliD [Agromyces humi]|uniref:flagellar filament capping protein FliD n=1 Tax=Agromyces humi TaxID=1766800 RepID=UPI001357EA7E|nr:flagellar filament capping protein FliD [Agromyces humi]
MGISLPGLASGLNSADLIAQLMQVEAAPQTLLKNKVAKAQSSVTDLQALNTKIAAFVESAKNIGKPGAIRAFSAKASDDSVTVKAGSTAQASELDVEVTKLAKTHTIVTGAISAWPVVPATMTFVDSAGEKISVTAASSSIDDIVRAVNNHDLGVKATKIASGADASGNPLYRIQFTATKPGEEAAFEAYQGSAADVDAGTATNLLSGAGSALISQGSDAELTLFAGTTAEQIVTSSSNTFADVLPGVEITVSKLTSAPVTVSVADDAKASADIVKKFVDDAASIFALIAAKSAVKTTTGSDGKSSATGGNFTGDSTVRTARQALASAIQAPVDGISPSTIGISFDKDGVLKFDAEKFAAAITENPDKVQTLFAAVADRVQTTSKGISDKYDGSLTSKIKGEESTIKDLGQQIEKWDTRLATRQANLERQYSALEVAMSKLNSQSTYLAGQLANLPKYSSGDDD